MNYRYIPLTYMGNDFSRMYYPQWQPATEEDMRYVKEMYPRAFREIQREVERECDRQEYVGSMMYDEYPDKLGRMRIEKRIFDTIKSRNNDCKEGCIKYPDDDWLKDVITVLLLNEMYYRRNKRRKYY